MNYGMKNEGVIKKLKDICNLYKDILWLVILFGSYSRNEARVDSDIDLYIETKDKTMTTLEFGENKRYREFRHDLYNNFSNEFDFLAYGGKRDLDRVKKTPLWKQISNDGVLIYDQRAKTI